ncbi:MAG: DUF72 domain-containing protein [Candidatus Bathyarchaeia archaeon]
MMVAEMIKVGCCGFPTSMEKYLENFSLVELNSTFYQYPREKTVKGWRERAPEGFEFTVKAHQDISHKAKLKIEEISLQAFSRMKEICRALNAKILLIQTPGSFKPDKLEVSQRFFEEVNREDLILVWETRGPAWENKETYNKLGQILEKLDVTHVTDPFRIMPAYTGKVAYFRLHGLGEQMYYYQYSDVELQKLRELILPYEKYGKEVYVLFNNLSMFEDGIRFKEYLHRGTFPKVITSVEAVVEKIRYPISKDVLLKKFGWKLVGLDDGKQVRLETILADLPRKAYRSVEEMLSDLKSLKK